MGPQAHVHRKAILTACKAALQSSNGAKDCATTTVALSRIRCLRNFGDTRARAVLTQLIERSTRASRAIRHSAFEALLSLSPRAAITLFHLRLGDVTDGCNDLRWVAQTLEQCGVFPAGTAAAWGRLWCEVWGRSESRDDALPRMEVAARAIHAHWGPRVDAETVRTFGELMPRFGDGRLETVTHALEGLEGSLLRSNPLELLHALTHEKGALRAFRFLRPEVVDFRMHRWSAVTWHAVLQRLEEGIGDIAPSPLRSFARHVPRGKQLTHALVLGQAPTEALERDIALDSNGRFALRYLDKRRDMLSFLRFADSVPCCFHSDSEYYHAPHWDTQAMVLSLWKDPLSFSFQVLSKRDDWAEPCGFVFGSYGLSNSNPVVLLNGIYLRRSQEKLRLAIVEKIEQELCNPIGIAALGIASRYGGAGILPEGYRHEARSVVRLRALTNGRGTQVQTIYDDISGIANQEFVTGYGLFWRELR